MVHPKTDCCCWWWRNPPPVDMVKYPIILQGFIHPRCRIFPSKYVHPYIGRWCNLTCAHFSNGWFSHQGYVFFFSGKSPDDTVRSGHEKILMGFSGYKFLVELARFFTVNFEDEFLFPRVRYVSSLGGNPQWWRLKSIAGGFAECQGGRAVRELEAGKLREGFFLEAHVRRMRMFQHQGNLRYLFNISYQGLIKTIFL